MSRSTPYIIVALLVAGAVLIWLLPPPVRLHLRAAEPTRKPTRQVTATPTVEVPAPTATMVAAAAD